MGLVLLLVAHAPLVLGVRGQPHHLDGDRLVAGGAHHPALQRPHRPDDGEHGGGRPRGDGGREGGFEGGGGGAMEEGGGEGKGFELEDWGRCEKHPFSFLILGSDTKRKRKKIWE